MPTQLEDQVFVLKFSVVALTIVALTVLALMKKLLDESWADRDEARDKHLKSLTEQLKLQQTVRNQWERLVKMGPAKLWRITLIIKRPKDPAFQLTCTYDVFTGDAVALEERTIRDTSRLTDALGPGEYDCSSTHQQLNTETNHE